MSNKIYNYSNSGIDRMVEQMQQMMKPVVDMINSTTYQSTIQLATKACIESNKIMQQYLQNNVVENIIRPTLTLYQNQMSKIIEVIPKIMTDNLCHTLSAYKNIINEINLNNLIINDNGTIEYEGETFYEEDINKATKELSTNSLVFKDKKQSILQKIILFILSAYICGIIGQAGAETYTYLKDRFLGIYEDVQSSNNEDNYFNEKCRIVDVPELNVRKSYSKDSKIIGKLYYLQLVKELEKVPYWTKIEYIDTENDIRIIGWVSTRCIKSYNQFKSEFNDIEE